MITTPETYASLHALVSTALGVDRKSLLIGVDGRDGTGKSSAATWLARQFGLPVVHLDLFAVASTQSAWAWRDNDLSRCISTRGQRPLIVEGVMLLDALSRIERQPDVLIFIGPSLKARRHDIVDSREYALENQIDRYMERANPHSRANLRIDEI